MSEQRRFNGHQRAALYLATGGYCADCGIELAPGWHADHKQAWSKGGATDVINGQALCEPCNLKKGNRDEHMDTEANRSEWPQGSRDWQLEAWDKYISDRKADWLLCATPGAGKTLWALGLARYLLDHNTIDRVVVVAPTQTIRDQWTEQTLVNLTVVPNEHGGLENHEDFEGLAETYAQVASQPDLQRMGCRARTLAIFDEVHHAGYPNRSWGDQTKYAFEKSTLRVGLTGTPWRRPGTGQIPFVTYDEKGEVCVDFAYEYGDALRDNVCRLIEFRAFNGEVEYVYLDSCARKTITYTLEDEDDNNPILRDLLKPDGAWIHSMLEKAHQELIKIRRGNDGEGAIPDAKGLVIADNQTSARIIAGRLEKLTKERPEVIISDEPDSEQALERFKTGTGMWAVAVNKFSEGVDAPALYVGVYATRKKTPLIFRQIVGRFVRRRVTATGEPRPEEECPAILFMPAVASLKELAEQIENELRHQVDIEREEYERELAEQGKLNLDNNSEEDDRQAIPTDISSAELDVVIIGGQSYLRAEYDIAKSYVDQLGFRNSEDVLRVAELLRKVGISTSTLMQPQPQTENTSKTTPHRYKKALKREIEQLARKKALALHIEHKEFNLNLSKRFGPRNELPIRKLEEELRWLEQLDTGTWEEELV